MLRRRSASICTTLRRVFTSQRRLLPSCDAAMEGLFGRLWYLIEGTRAQHSACCCARDEIAILVKEIVHFHQEINKGVTMRFNIRARPEGMHAWEPAILAPPRASSQYM